MRDSQAKSLLSSSASALYSSNVVPVHTPSVSLAGFNNLLDQSTSVVGNPAIFSVGSQYSLSIDLDLGIYGSVPCDLPREVVWDTLAVNLGTRCGATVSRQGFNNFESSENI